MARDAAVGVDDDLAAGQPGVALRATDDERAGRVHQQAVAGGVEVELLEHGRDDVLGDRGTQLRLQVDVRLVLRGEDDGVEPDGAVAVVADGDLRLAVGAQAGDDALLAHERQALGQPVREPDRQRQERRRLVARVAEHQALVARALQVERVDVGGVLADLERLVDARGDVRRLLTDRDGDAARVAVEPDVRGRVADAADDLADDLRDLDVRARRHLAGDVHEAGGHHRLDRDARLRVLLEDRVEDRVGDLVTDLVRVPLGHGLGREQAHVGLGHGATA